MITLLSSLPLSLLLLPGTTLLVDPNFTVSVSMVTAISAQIDWTVPEVNDNIQYRLQIKKEGKYNKNYTFPFYYTCKILSPITDSLFLLQLRGILILTSTLYSPVVSVLPLSLTLALISAMI